MLASKHTIYLSKNHNLDGSNGSTNVFLFNENGKKVQAKWVRKSVEQNNGNFVVLDHNNTILDEVKNGLLKRHYYIEVVDFDDIENGIKINPFDLVTNTSEIHFMFLNFLYILWDNTDPDIAVMSNLMDAFASCVYQMFSNKKEKLNMATLKKMVYSVRATCQTEDGLSKMSDEIFRKIKDENSMPVKYYNQFLRAAGNRKEEIEEKLACAFDMLTASDIAMMSETDDSLEASLNFKTAVFVNVKNEKQEASAKIMITLLNAFVQQATESKQTLFILDSLSAQRCLIGLPLWLKDSVVHNMSFVVMCNDLASFKKTEEAERFFQNLRKVTDASVLMHHNDDILRFENELPNSGEELAAYTERSAGCAGGTAPKRP